MTEEKTNTDTSLPKEQVAQSDTDNQATEKKEDTKTEETPKIKELEDKFANIKPGDQVTLKYKIQESSMEQTRFKGKAQEKIKERFQPVEGLVIARKHGSGINGTITLRTNIESIGTERIFPVHSPLVTNVQKKARFKVRRSKLYYLRKLTGRAAKLKRIQTR